MFDSVNALVQRQLTVSVSWDSRVRRRFQQDPSQWLKRRKEGATPTSLWVGLHRPWLGDNRPKAVISATSRRMQARTWHSARAPRKAQSPGQRDASQRRHSVTHAGPGFDARHRVTFTYVHDRAELPRFPRTRPRGTIVKGAVSPLLSSPTRCSRTYLARLARTGRPPDRPPQWVLCDPNPCRVHLSRARLIERP